MNRMKKIKRAVSFLCVLALILSMFPAQSFAENRSNAAGSLPAAGANRSDVAGHWAEAQIGYLLEKGAVNGYQDGSFKPDQPITRAEFMAIVNRAFQFTEKAEISYTDVKAGAWYAEIVGQAKQAGYLGGYFDGTVRPNNKITRQEAASILARIKQLKENPDSIQTLKDRDAVPGWSRGIIGAVLDAGLMSGYPDGTFRAGSNITRAEAAAVLSRALGAEKYATAGVYGPASGTKVVPGDVSVAADGITLQNMRIDGDLFLEAGIGEGTVTLKNITVKGTTSIKGGGENSIIVIDSTLGTVTVSKENGKIRIVVSGNTTVAKVVAGSGVRLEEGSLTGNAAGFREVVIDGSENDTVILLGSFDQVSVEGKNVTVNVPGATVIRTMILNRAAAVTGSGTIELARLNANGVTFEKAPKKTETGANVTMPAVSGGKSGGSSSGNNSGNNGHQPADLVLKNGQVYSVNSTVHTARAVESQAVAVKDGAIVYVGSDAGAAAYIGSNTQVIDLEEKMVLPGFADTHTHAQAMVSNLFALNLYTVTTKEQCLDAVADWIAKNPGIGYITGNGWSLPNFGNELPTKEDLDSVCDDIPVALYDSTHHVLWANSLAISNAEITADTKNPPGGIIDRVGGGSSGEPSGTFHEDSAMDLVMASFPDFEVWQYKEAIKAYQAMVNSFGVTLTYDPLLPAGGNAVEAYKQLAEDEALTMYVRGAYGSGPVLQGDQYEEIDTAKEKIDEYVGFISERRDEDQVGDLFRMIGVKLFEDGAGGSFYTAEPFQDGTSSGAVWPDDQFQYICKELDQRGFQIHVHAMGDAAVSHTLDGLEAAADESGRTDSRHIITHLMMVKSDDVERLADLNVVGAPQPYWMCRDNYYSRMYWPLLGEDRTNAFYPNKSLVEAGIVMTSASDYPVTSPNAPLVGMQSGVTRVLPYDNADLAMFIPDAARNPEYRYPLGPVGNPEEECVDLKTMIQATTINGAYATFLEDLTGSVEVGKSGDLVVLDKNIFDVSAGDIGKANVMMTLFRGQVVYQSGLTVSDQDVIPYKSEPTPANGFAAPYRLQVAYGTSTRQLSESLNPPMGGSFEIRYTPEKALELSSTGPAIDEDVDVTEDMVVVAMPERGPAAAYQIAMLPEKLQNTIAGISDITDTGCTITFDEVLPGLTKADFYLLRDSNKVSATTIAVTSSDGGKTYVVEARDIDEDGRLMACLTGAHSLYVYAPDWPLYIPVPRPFPETVFTNQGMEVVFP